MAGNEILIGGAGFVAGLVAGSLNADLGREVADEHYPEVLDKAAVFADVKFGMALIVGTGSLLIDQPPAMRNAFVLEEKQWYVRTGGNWVPDATTQAEFEQFDLRSNLSTRTVETQGCHLP